MNKTSSLPLLIPSLCAVLTACSGMTVASDYDRQVAFDTYETFGLADEAGEFNILATDGYSVVLQELSLAADLKELAADVIKHRLESKGLKMTDVDTADLIVTYVVNVGAKPEVIAPDYRLDSWSSEQELGQKPIAQGTLILDVLDPDLDETDRSFLVWRGWAKTDIDENQGQGEDRGKKLKEALTKVLARYPR